MIPVDLVSHDGRCFLRSDRKDGDAVDVDEDDEYGLLLEGTLVDTPTR
jgi:hypothetical protein